MKGTRIAVDLILEELSHSPDIAELLAAHPDLTRDDVRACFAYAKDIVAGGESLLSRRMGCAVMQRYEILFDQSADFRLIPHSSRLGHDVSVISRNYLHGLPDEDEAISLPEQAWTSPAMTNQGRTPPDRKLLWLLQVLPEARHQFDEVAGAIA